MLASWISNPGETSPFSMLLSNDSLPKTILNNNNNYYYIHTYISLSEVINVIPRVIHACITKGRAMGTAPMTKAKTLEVAGKETPCACTIFNLDEHTMGRKHHEHTFSNIYFFR